MAGLESHGFALEEQRSCNAPAAPAMSRLGEGVELKAKATDTQAAKATRAQRPGCRPPMA